MRYAVAVIGMCGSGKSVLTDLFVELGWGKVYFGGVVVNQLKQSNIAVNEQNEKQMRNWLREQHGKGAMAKLLVEEIKQKLTQGNVVLDGLYSWSEYTFLQEALEGRVILLAIVTNSSVRYQRLTNRTIRPLTAQQARSRDYAEIESSEKGGPIAIADYYIDNNGSLQHTKEQFAQFLKWFEENYQQ